MASHTITISTEAYKRLKDHKSMGESFSEVILREMPIAPARTAGEVLERAKEFEGQELLNEKAIQRLMERKKGRKVRNAA
jgi:predicted CopG family antitoxin